MSKYSTILLLLMFVCKQAIKYLLANIDKYLNSYMITDVFRMALNRNRVQGARCRVQGAGKGKTKYETAYR